MDFPGGSMVKNLPANAEDASLIPGFHRSSGGGNDSPSQYHYLENHMDKGVWQTTVHGVEKSTTDQACMPFSPLFPLLCESF